MISTDESVAVAAEAMKVVAARSLVTLPTTEVSPPTSELTRSAVDVGNVVPVPGPVSPAAREASEVVAVTSEEVVASPESELVKSRVVASEVVEVDPVVIVPTSLALEASLRTSLFVEEVPAEVANTCEVAPVPAPVAVGSTVVGVSRVESDTRLSVVGTAVVGGTVVESVMLSLGVKSDVASTDLVLAIVEDWVTIP